MKKFVKTAIATAVINNILSMAYAADDIGGDMVLDTIEVITQGFKEREETYKKSGAVSIRDEINKSDKNLDEIIRSAPGTFTQMNKAAGAVSVNIRGATGFGRVNTMVDGVSQTFYSSGGDTGGKGGAGSQFGAAIDPAFITSVEVNRGSFNGASGANTLMGSSNFKTIGVDDILRFDRNVGGMIKSQVGTNDTKPEWMMAVAGKKIFDYGGSLGVLYGQSRKTITQNYKVGGGQTHREISEAATEEIRRDYINSYGIDSERLYDITPYDPEKVKQKPVSHIFKTEYADDYNLLELQYRKTTNHLAGRTIKGDTKQVKYNLTLPENNFVDFNILYAKNKNTQNYDVGSTIINRTITAPLTGKNESTTLDINNTLRFDLPFEANLAITPGVNWLKNKYSKNRYPNELRIFKPCEYDGDTECFSTSGGYDPTRTDLNLYETVNASLPTNSFFPKGNQRLNTIYWDNQLDWNMFTLNYNINIVKYKNKGESLNSVDQEYYKIQGKIDELDEILESIPEDSEGAEEKHEKILAQIHELEEEQERFDETYEYDREEGYKKRPTFRHDHTVKNHFVNYSAMLTANVSNYFTPFIGYSKTHRVPTIQEMFFSSLTDAGMNLDLQPETAKTKQLGFNGFIDGAITENDRLGYKLTGYETRIENFIHNVNRAVQVRGINPVFGYQTLMTIYHRNYDVPVKVKGFEAELSYDMGKFFANLAYSRQMTNQPASYSDLARTGSNINTDQAELQSFGLTKVTILPNSYGSLELGTRFFDNKLTLGVIAKYYGKSKRSKYDPIGICEGGGRIYFDDQRNRPVCPGYMDTTHKAGSIAEYKEIDHQPMVYDLYAIYEPTENLMIKLAVDNVTDRRYVNPLDANNDSASQYSDAIHPIPNSNGDYSYVKEYQNNFARGRTFKLNLSYKF
ncbi:TonB-dependent receptor plug domain-containing protein [Otariodibacter oris]|uniref:Hemoglobin/transferrin/lactoferrin receptor protein n=1 Tax=Otariodibacter oris TaxID=1032623 RepID=A0A420XJD4_9PAST|nr:TonB-dependent receptor plug domain-containing protein [Otariodibacter oris]RKR77467.1 hemoglobin/transferrin/lactoferrin receptor protein [Otariodibacter oris]